MDKEDEQDYRSSSWRASFDRELGHRDSRSFRFSSLGQCNRLHSLVKLLWHLDNGP
ncbi:MAG: hypothetical protein KC416_11050 [Myxococcales bacterium]|nr:hypothetical protein [Myxococcales bacterium]